MAVELLAFSSAAAASIHNGGDGELIQYQSDLTFLGFDLIRNGEAEFQTEINRVLKTILLKISPGGCYTTSPPVDVVELTVPVVKFPDGGHRCPYFPCPTCHRSRRLFPDTERKSIKVSFLNFDCISDLFTCDSEGKISSHPVYPVLIVYPDKGHKCEEFPCPICHKNDRSG